MKGIIWYYTDIKGAEEMLDSIAKKYLQCGVSGSKTCRKQGSFCEFINGDSWKIVKAGAAAHGSRCNIAYIERNIPLEVYRTIITHTMFDYPYSGIHFWGEGDLHISNEPYKPF